MIELYDNDSGKLLGAIDDVALQFLIDQLEEESAEDKDYWLNRDSLDQFAEIGCPAALLELLKKALGDRKDMEIRWEKK
jgi:processive 1,2-diacylglycerol beta-glucosyltransferase